MKTKKDIENALDKLPPTGETKYPAMTYEQGAEEALLWTLDEPETLGWMKDWTHEE